MNNEGWSVVVVNECDDHLAFFFLLCSVSQLTHNEMECYPRHSKLHHETSQVQCFDPLSRIPETELTVLLSKCLLMFQHAAGYSG